MKKRIYSLGFALLLVISLVGCSRDNVEEETTTGVPEETTHAPDFTVYDADGKPVKLSDKHGTPVVVNFWASWCSPCKQEMPDFDALAKAFEGRVEFMMVNLTDGVYETKDEAKGFVDSEGYTFPVYFDTDSNAATVYDIRSIPTTLFINAEGELVTFIVGKTNADTIKHGISLIYKEVSDK